MTVDEAQPEGTIRVTAPVANPQARAIEEMIRAAQRLAPEIDRVRAQIAQRRGEHADYVTVDDIERLTVDDIERLTGVELAPFQRRLLNEDVINRMNQPARRRPIFFEDLDRTNLVPNPTRATATGAWTGPAVTIPQAGTYAVGGVIPPRSMAAMAPTKPAGALCACEEPWTAQWVHSADGCDFQENRAAWTNHGLAEATEGPVDGTS